MLASLLITLEWHRWLHRALFNDEFTIATLGPSLDPVSSHCCQQAASRRPTELNEQQLPAGLNNLQYPVHFNVGGWISDITDAAKSARPWASKPKTLLPCFTRDRSWGGEWTTYNRCWV